MSMSCFDCHDYMDGYNRGKKEGLIEELEKIKAEIDLIKDSKSLIDDFDSVCERIKDLLDKHIAELKGENK